MSSDVINIGDLCMYHDIPVIVLEKREDIYYKLGYEKIDTIYLCLFHNGCDTVSGNSLSKIKCFI